MTISKDLLLAILSMDAYNRGYGAGISDGGENDPDGLGEASDGTVRVGSSVVSSNLEDAGIAQEAQDAGFYAIAYDTDYGTVISYRGKNNTLGIQNSLNSADRRNKQYVDGHHDCEKLTASLIDDTKKFPQKHWAYE